MSRKRMIDPSIWADEDFGKLSKDGRLLFIGLFSNADDEGRIRANPAYIRSTIFMYDDLTIKKVDEVICEVAATMSSVKLYELDGNRYIQLDKWEEYQYQQKDRVQASKLPNIADAKQMLSKCSADAKQVLTEIRLDKDRLDKIRLDECKGGSAHDYTKIENIGETDFEEIAEHYSVPIAFVRSKHEDMVNWHEMKPNKNRYSNYRRALMDWVKRDALKINQQEAGHARRVSIIPIPE